MDCATPKMLENCICPIEQVFCSWKINICSRLWLNNSHISLGCWQTKAHRHCGIAYSFRVNGNPIRHCILRLSAYIRIGFATTTMPRCMSFLAGYCNKAYILNSVEEMATNKGEHVTKWHFVKCYFPGTWCAVATDTSITTRDRSHAHLMFTVDG